MPLHLDCRPDDFSGVVGNKTAVASLQSTLARKDHNHVMLFHGPAGCGKTTLARIVAKKLGCAASDLQEVNSSNNRGIDTARDIIAGMHYKPLGGSVRVYLLDEVHKTTNDFQNAMLKALEEPPEHVYFLLCTTDPDKLIKAVRSRCAVFPVQNLTSAQIMDLLKRTCKEQKIKLSDDILEDISKNVDGSPRQALIVLDQVRDADDAEIARIIRESQIEEKQVIDLCRRLLHTKATWKSVSEILSGIEVDIEKVRWAVLGYMSAVLIKEDNPRAALCIDIFSTPFYNNGKAGLVYACYQVVSD